MINDVSLNTGEYSEIFMEACCFSGLTLSTFWGLARGMFLALVTEAETVGIGSTFECDKES